MKDKKLISIVISLYNESENIKKLFEELRVVESELKDDVDIEFVCVNDGSTDNTLQLLKEEAAQSSNIRIYNFYRNFGHEIAMTAGMDNSKGDAVIFMDGDLQHPPHLIKDMVRYWLDGTRVVLTKKITKDCDKSFLYKTLSEVYYFTINKLSDFEIPRDYPDFRLLDRKEISLLSRIDEHDRMFRGMLNFIGFQDYKVIEFEVPKRFAGSTKYNFTKSLGLAVDSILQFSVRPLRFITYLGVLSTILASLLAAVTLIEYLFFNSSRTGYATLLIAMLFMGSVQVIILGLIGEYIAKIHIEVKKRPLYFGEFIENNN